MLSPVDFDDQAMFPADEIYNVRSDGLLPHKFHSVKPTRAESIPKPLFGNCGIAAQPARVVCLCNFCAMHEAAPRQAPFAPRQSGRDRRNLTPKAAAWAPSPRLRGEGRGEGASPQGLPGISCEPTHNNIYPYTFSTSGRPSRPWGRKISVMARIE